MFLQRFVTRLLLKYCAGAEYGLQMDKTCILSEIPLFILWVLWHVLPSKSSRRSHDWKTINYSRGSQQTNRVRDYSFYPTEKALRPEQRHIKTQKNKIIHLQCKACQLPLSVMIVPVHVLNLANRISIKSEEERVGEKVSPIFSIWTAVLISTSGCQCYIL